MNIILIAVCVLGLIGLASAIVLFVVSHKFAVHEDPRIAQVGDVLPQANCGGCGYPGCSGMAAALADGSGSIDKCKPSKPDAKEAIKKYLAEHPAAA